MKRGLDKTKKSFSEKINSLISSFKKVDEEFFEELEETLILSDMGVNVAEQIIEKIKKTVREKKVSETSEIKELLKDEIERLLFIPQKEKGYPLAILVVGVNGVGKTTTIGKLANIYKKSGKSVMLAAADTFRAAAAEQLTAWAARANVDIIKYNQEGADPAAVIYDAVDSCKHKKTDVLICDTAGRLHNKKNLMNELEKIKKVLDREYPEAQKETFLVIDATTGQNAITQVRVFNEVTNLTGIILTKLDGTAKGGVVIELVSQSGLPVKYVGVGEGIDDLDEFDAREFAHNIL